MTDLEIKECGFKPGDVYARREDGRKYKIITMAAARDRNNPSSYCWTIKMVVHKPVSDIDYPCYVEPYEDFLCNFKRVDV